MGARFSLLSTTSTDASGASTKTTSTTYASRLNLRLDRDVFPTLNVNAGLVVEGEWSDITGDTVVGETGRTTLLPSIWLTFRDPTIRSSIGYDRRQETFNASGVEGITLTRDTYSAALTWRPLDLPWTEARYTRTRTWDDPRGSLDTTENYVYVKSEYDYRGLRANYLASYLRSEDNVRDVLTTQLTHGPYVLYSTTFLDDRISISTEDRVTFLKTENLSELPLQPIAGLSSLDDTPQDGPSLAPNPALVDGNLTSSAGVNIGFPGLGGNFQRRNVGLDFLTSVVVNRLLVWVDGWGPDTLPADIATWFSWDIYTSTDNLTWTFHTTVMPAVFGPFDRRFEINFPAVSARYIKAVTRPLPGGIIGSTNSSLYPNILITELQAFVNRPVPQAKGSFSQTVQRYNFDARVTLLRTPSLYYQLSGYYYQVDTDTQAAGRRQYNISNGLFLTHQFNPVFSTTANASFDFGEQQGETRQAVLYYASLTAAPLPTFTSNIVFTGYAEWLGGAENTSNSLTLYNTAQLYKGIDAILNVGTVFSSVDAGDGNVVRRRDLLVTAGMGITPNPRLTLSAYYSGQFSNVSTGSGGASGATNEHRFDLGLSFTPFPSLFLSAAVNIASTTGEDTLVLQNYGLSWTPFPDGRLQLSLYFTEGYSPDLTRTIQPTLRWYLGPRRRSYVEASYAYNKAGSNISETESHLFSTTLRIFF